jgi:GNAT superfamily N-acetyltransferase
VAVLEVVPVTPDRWDALVALFTPSSSQSSCWCMWPRRARGAFRPRDPANRESMRDLVLAGATPGLLCLDDAQPLGWCALGPCRDFPQYAASAETATHANGWAIPCIYVTPDSRGKGVGDALVSGAKEYAALHGATILHGPPPWWKAREETEHGAVSRLLSRQGFVESAPGARIPLFCCDLTAGREDSSA